eukprot:gene7382-5196_t
MNKSKTVEYLRGMKFMQRKEEVKRREKFETQRREGVLRGLGDSELGGRAATTGPTILRDTRFNRNHYQLARQSFLIKEVLPETSVPDEEETRKRSREEQELYPDQVWGENDVVDSEGDGDTLQDPTAPDVSKQGDRFVLSDSVRAPKMPRALEKEVMHNRGVRDVKYNALHKSVNGLFLTLGRQQEYYCSSKWARVFDVLNKVLVFSLHFPHASPLRASHPSRDPFDWRIRLASESFVAYFLHYLRIYFSFITQL